MERWFLPNGHVKHFKGGCGKYLKLTRETENTKLQRFYKKRRNYPCERERLQNKIVSGHAHIKCKIVDEQNPEKTKDVIAYSGYFLIKDWLAGLNPLFRKVRAAESSCLVPRYICSTKELQNAIDRALRKRKPFTIYLL